MGGDYPEIYLVTVSGHFYFSDYYWLPASEFPMPAVPKSEIAPCPFCANVVRLVENGDEVWIECTFCEYQSMRYFDKQKAIDSHNHYAREGNE